MFRGFRRWRTCAFGCLAIVFLVGVTLGVVGFLFHRNLVEFAEGGFSQLSGGPHQEWVTSPDGRLLLFGSSVDVRADSEYDIIILGSTATLYNRVGGNVYFRGDLLEIAETAVIEGKLKIESQRLIIRGEVKGPIEGKPGQVENHRTHDFITP